MFYRYNKKLNLGEKMLSGKLIFIYHSPFTIHHSNPPFESSLLNSYKKGRIASLFVFQLYSLCSMLYSPLSKLAFSNLNEKTVPLSTFDSTCILLPWA